MKTIFSVEQGNLRPPSESRSLLLRVVRNCPWNRCIFCPAYKEKKFSTRTVEEIIKEIDIFYNSTNPDYVESIFLQDADALIIPTDRIIKILNHITKRFPDVKRITSYSRSSTLAKKTVEELTNLKNAGVSRIHVGLESGCDEVLEFVKKGVTSEKQLQGCLNVKQAGIQLCTYFMPGLGGKKYSEKHAVHTGKLLAQIQPEHIRLRTCFVLEGTELAQEYLNGNFEPLTEEETVREILLMLSFLENVNTEIVSDHRINLLLELNGKLPGDYGRLVNIIQEFLNLNDESKKLFVVGRRLGIIRKLEDLKNGQILELIKKNSHLYKDETPVPKNILY